MKQAAKQKALFTKAIAADAAAAAITRLELRRNDDEADRLPAPPATHLPPARHQGMNEPRLVGAHRFPGLFDRLRDLAPEQGHSIVLAPACEAVSIGSALRALTADAERARFRTLVMSCTVDPRGLALGVEEPEVARQQSAYREVPASLRDRVLWRPSATDGAAPVAGVLAVALEAFDLIILEGPALSSCPDAAHLARACDGLVIVAQAQATTKDELRAAADNARISGCEVLGIIFAEPSHWLTDLLHKL